MSYITWEDIVYYSKYHHTTLFKCPVLTDDPMCYNWPLMKASDKRPCNIKIRCNLMIFGPRQANLVLTGYASSEGSGEPAHPRSLARTSTARSSSELRGTLRQKAKSLAPLNGWVCTVKMCHDGMLEDTNSLDRAHFTCTLKG